MTPSDSQIDFTNISNTFDKSRILASRTYRVWEKMKSAPVVK